MEQSFRLFLTEQQTAAYLSVSLSTIRRWRHNNIGPRSFKFRGVLRYRRDWLDAFVAKYAKDTIERPAISKVEAAPNNPAAVSGGQRVDPAVQTLDQTDIEKPGGVRNSG
jgi:hypothetical protein